MFPETVIICGNTILPSTPCTDSETDGDSNTTTSSTGFCSNPETITDDTFINPKFIVDNGKPIDYLQQTLQCCICSKISEDKIYECRLKEHVFCSGCYQHLQSEELTCPINTCEGEISGTPSSLVKNLLQNADFLCIHPGCTRTVKGGVSWQVHVRKECPRRSFMICPDDTCEDVVLKKANFVSHCKRRHIRNVCRINPFEVDVIVPSVSSDLWGCKWIASVVKFEGNFLYFIVDLAEPNIVSVSCFTLLRKAVIENLRVQISTLSEQVDQPQISAFVKINFPERDLDEVTHYGRSALFFTAELDNIFNCGEDLKEERTYTFEIKITKNFPAERVFGFGPRRDP